MNTEEDISGTHRTRVAISTLESNKLEVLR